MKQKINTEHFPTIREMSEAIRMANPDVISVGYDALNREFNFVEMVPYPCYDDGGSIDSIDYKESMGSLSFQQAYNLWDSSQIDFEPSGLPIAKYPAPVAPSIFDDTDLPF